MTKKRSYLLKIYYMNNKIDKHEYQTHEFLINATPKTLTDVVSKEIISFNNVNRPFGFKVESYSVYEHILSGNL